MKMSEQKIGIQQDVLEAYDQHYSEEIKEWRTIGGAFKAKNIIDCTQGHSFNSMADVGSGDGSVLEWLEKFGFSKNLTSFEISTSGIAQIKALNLKSLSEVKQFDGYNIPAEDGVYDLALCSHVVEHVEYERVLLREIKRISKYQVFEVPIDFSLKLDKQVRHYLDYGHINIYTPQQFKFLLMSEGFEIIKSLPRMHDKAMFDYLHAKGGVKKIKEQVKRLVWRNVPILLNTIPNVFTVFTKSTDKGMRIFESGFNAVQ